MFSYLKTHGKAVLSVGLVALVAVAVFAPACAYADEVTRTMDWTMTITLQNASGQALTSTKAPGTGDSSLFIIIGSLAIIAGAVYLLCASRKLARSTAGPAASQDSASSRTRTTLVAIAAAMIAGLCIALFAYSTAVAHADERQAEIQGTSTVVVNEQGKVLNSSISIANNYASAINILSVQAPERLKDWTVNLSQSSVEAGGKASGSWNAKTIPSDVLTELKNNGGKLTLKTTGLISYRIGAVPYTVNHYAANLDGTYPTEPTTAETMYGVEGDSTQAKALEMEGFTAQEFSQTTVKPDGTAVVSIQYSRNSYQVEFDGNGHSISTPEQTVKFGATVAKPDNPVAGGLTFDGWFADVAGTQAYDFETTTMPANDVKLYAKWSLTPIDFSKATVDTDDKTYVGQEIKPSASIEGLAEGTDYTVAYSNNRNAGTASIKLTGIGDYTGEKTYTFNILPAEVKVSGIVAISKDYDGTTAAQLDCSKAVVEGLCGTDAVTVTAKGTFEDANVGENKKVLISDIALEGDAASNYKLAATGQQTEATAMIVGNYRITYKNVDKAINLNPEGYSSTDESFNLVDAVWEGYDFDGWYDKDGTTTGDWGNKVTTITKGTNKDVTLWAKWTARPYHLTYYYDRNGDQSKKYEYDVKCGEKLTAPDVTELDYLVTGWYTSDSYEQQWDFSTETMPAGDLSLYAKWHKKLCTITFLDPDGSPSSVPLTQTVRYGDTPTAPSWQPTMRVINGKIFNNWYYDEAGTQPFDYTIPIYDDLTVYGKRYDYAYWLGKAGNEVWPMKELVKSPDELQADIKVLKDEDHAVYSAEEYNKVKAEYETYVKEDQVVLYTYVGTGDKYGEDNLMEFRIVEAGRHDNGNGTKSEGVLTFQSKSCLLNAYKLNNADDYTSWKTSIARQVLLEDGEVGKQFDQRLRAVMATNTTPYFDIKTGKIEYCDDKLFMLSYLEIFGSNPVYGIYSAEGTQYTYYKIDGNLSDDKLIPLGETLYGSFPYPTEPYDSSEESLKATKWWTRTVANSNGSLWNVVYRGKTEYPVYHVTSLCGVVPAFSM